MKTRIIDYKACSGSTREELEKAIEEAKREGWSLNGYPIEYSLSEGESYIQIMVKYNTEYPN